MKISKLRNIKLNYMNSSKCFFSGYTGKHISDKDLVKKDDNWYIEETNFCLGRVTKLRFSEKDDMARRVLKIMDSQLSKMYTRMRDGTVIPYMSFYLNDVIDKPAPNHQFIEQPLIKWTWDEAYDEAYEEN
ncbi:hypothetical protein, conserved in Apicomplexan species [Plasmodium knowlesi strain H]|uniref:Uncharacterized protein n=3 Tax=Plasmodium knowlesi TaxID=5850 RepID=A0A5K1U9R8_PLAKH|nr:uncharacterized protein PKNH_1009600 [Plasmodium knowlesi strain H]OTN66958.1 Uncharacterized protein PKNOH_S07447500 [Plasmodium knowlesi]CAA9988602.1 cytochrome c oxidase subunit ApiCOX18, putative [Plasmodium knowlesi strain H]SBO21431.1 hypothetical protein, conserved in Apicomplexan species [Plasmodium knowlesi strain H]SBO21876.1 hypothetical protein, conserved in Apicomplexan species [Plasmodium knowlesi strain H]VVS78076.1 cytochrome c oxidase subunit ApiCOX18, putative [Plasmodium |eukprot:XP_002259578.1 [Plasmodium knowlesi strain H]